MATENLSDFDPFRPPNAQIGPAGLDLADEEAERIRRTYLRHEGEVKSVGSLALIVAFLLGLVAGSMVLAALGRIEVQNRATRSNITPELALIIAAVSGGVATLQLATGVGLRRLMPWARWVTYVLVGLSFLSYIARFALWVALPRSFPGRAGDVIGNTIATLVSGYIVYLMASPKGAKVFSSEYREVVKRTPEIRPQMGCLPRLLALLILAIVTTGIIVILFLPSS